MINNNAFSLLEVLLASIVLVIAVAGVFATLHSVRVKVTNKETALAASAMGCKVLDSLLYAQDNTYVSKYGLKCSDVPSCGAFEIATLGTHRIDNTTLIHNGLSWPGFPSGWDTENKSCQPAPCLVYTVQCAPGTDQIGAPGIDCPHQVILHINWPEMT
ncbi:MAG: hypothetical protein HQL13_01270 [Candidatus Omnitrophica bacterium]|nr:hypothetical protein [Candidatus Omnitrophota bacterium]